MLLHSYITHTLHFWDTIVFPHPRPLLSCPSPATDGRLALQFLNKTQLLLIPIPIIVVSYIISLFGFHISKSVVEMYFRN